MMLTLPRLCPTTSLLCLNETVDSFGLPITLSADQTDCGVCATYDYIYTNTNAAAELVDLLHNISQVISILNQVASWLIMHIQPRVYSYLLICLHIHMAM